MTVLAIVLLLVQAPGPPWQQPAPVDTLVEVGGYQMHLRVHRGTRPVTIVMESGGGASLGAWSGLDSTLAARTGATLVAYDRAGFGASSVGPADLVPRQQIEDLTTVLRRLGVPPIRIIVGTSYGGLLAVLHARLHHGDVRGLVLVDPMNPRFVQATGDFVYSTVPRLDHPATPRDTAVMRMVRTFDRLIRDPNASDAGLNVPLTVITAGIAWFGRADIDRAWRASHEAMARAAPERRLVVAHGSAHDIAAKRPDLIVEAAVALVDAVSPPGPGHRP